MCVCLWILKTMQYKSQTQFLMAPIGTIKNKNYILLFPTPGDSNHSSYVLNITLLLCKTVQEWRVSLWHFIHVWHFTLVFSLCLSPYSLPLFMAYYLPPKLFIPFPSLFLSSFCLDISSFLLMVFLLFSTYTHTFKHKNVYV